MVKSKTVKRITVGLSGLKGRRIGLSQAPVGNGSERFNIKNDLLKNNVLITDKLLLPKSRELPPTGTPGQIIFNSGDKTFYGWNGGEWVSFAGGGGEGFERVVLPIDNSIDPNISRTLVEGVTGFDWATKVAGTDYDSAYYSRLASINDASQVVAGVIYTSDPLNVYNTNGSFAFSLPITFLGAYDTAIIHYSADGLAHCVGKLASVNYLDTSGVQINNEGNIIAVGFYSDTISVYNGDLSLSFEMSNSGSDDAFLVKYTIDGTAEWGAKIAGVNSDTANSVAINNNSDIAIVGISDSSEVDIYNSDGTIAASLALIANSDAFVAKYDKDGFLDWSAKSGSNYTISFNGVDINNLGEIIVVGRCQGSVVNIYNKNGSIGASLYGGSSLTNTLLLIKYTSTGIVSWATHIEGNNYPMLLSVKTNSWGNIYVSGGFEADLSIYNSNGSFTATLVYIGPGYNNFLIKYNSGGMYEWAVPIGGYIGTDPSCYTNNADNVFIAGRYNNVLQIYNEDGTLAFTLAPASISSAYLIKYDSLGDACWATKVGNINNSGGEISYSVACNNIGEIVLAGEYSSSPVNVYNSDGSVAATLDNEGSGDVFIVKYIDDGQLTLGNPITDGQCKTIATNGASVQINTTSSIEGLYKSILLEKYDAVEMLWDAVQSNWIVISNEGTLI